MKAAYHEQSIELNYSLETNVQNHDRFRRGTPSGYSQCLSERR